MRTVVVFGAGATKACGGPLTNEILPQVLSAELRGRLERDGMLALVERFLDDAFNLPPRARRRQHDFPSLPLVLSLIDTAIDRGDALGSAWGPDELREIRRGVEYAVFALLEYRLRTVAPYYQRFLGRLYGRGGAEVTVVSLNYDLIADNALAALGERRGSVALPDYTCDVATDSYREVEKFGRLLKLHGSLNWLYCPNCHRLDVGLAPSGRRMVKMLNTLYLEDLNAKYRRRGSPCPKCGATVRPVLITPTHLKDYRNPHIAHVWYEAERALRDADRATFIGYSMPDDDVEVIYLLKRGLGHLKPAKITVVEHASTAAQGRIDRHPVGQRYRALFGNGIDWHAKGFAAWVDGA